MGTKGGKIVPSGVSFAARVRRICDDGADYDDDDYDDVDVLINGARRMVDDDAIDGGRGSRIVVDKDLACRRDDPSRLRRTSSMSRDESSRPENDGRIRSMVGMTSRQAREMRMRDPEFRNSLPFGCVDATEDDGANDDAAEMSYVPILRKDAPLHHGKRRLLVGRCETTTWPDKYSGGANRTR